jgi:hypothetical protein
MPGVRVADPDKDQQPTANVDPLTHNNRRRKRGDESRPSTAGGLVAACAVVGGSVRHRRRSDRGTHEFTSHFPSRFTRSIRKSCPFVFDPAFGSSATSICASFGYEKSIFIGAYFTSSTGYGTTAMLPVFHDERLSLADLLGHEVVCGGKILPPILVFLMNVRATCVAPGGSFTVGGTCERSSGGRLVNGVAVLVPVFDQMIPAAIKPPTTRTAMTHGMAFCQPGRCLISVRKTDSASVLIVTAE